MRLVICECYLTERNVQAAKALGTLVTRVTASINLELRIAGSYNYEDASSAACTNKERGEKRATDMKAPSSKEFYKL